MQKPPLTAYTFIGFYVMAAIDSGHADKLSFDDVYRGLKRGTLFPDMAQKLPGALFDFSMWPHGSDQERALLEPLKVAAGGLEERERRKTGVEHSGLCLLMAFILEVIQNGDIHRERV
jgi:hypothetical protein